MNVFPLVLWGRRMRETPGLGVRPAGFQPCVRAARLLPSPSPSLRLTSVTANTGTAMQQGCRGGQSRPSRMLGSALGNQNVLGEKLTQTVGRGALAVPLGSW